MTRQLLNTLYVQTEGAKLSLDHENVVVEIDGEKKLRVPLHHLGSIVGIGRVTMTSPLIGRCAKDGRTIVQLDSGGRFLYRIEGPKTGNVMLRTAQYQTLMDKTRASKIVQAIIAGKLYNSRQMILRCAREAEEPESQSSLKQCAKEMQLDLKRLSSIQEINELRGIEGINAKRYFSQFNHRLKCKAEDNPFCFSRRTKRPPRDPMNALLSFLYVLLSNDCIGAIEGVGLDPQIGYLHALRPGRPSLALDLMEEFRPILSDRIALTLINRQQIQSKHFDVMPGGAVHLNKKGRELVLAAYQQRKKDEVTHQILKEKIPLGLIVHLQARLLARAIRKDYMEYQPFFYK